MNPVSLAAALLLLAVAPAWADDTMRCGSRLVSTGDAKPRVRALCGEPTDVAFGGVIGRRSSSTHSYRDYAFYGPTWVELPVEIWTYNFGSNKLVRRLRFVGDELVDIRTDGYGY